MTQSIVTKQANMTQRTIALLASKQDAASMNVYEQLAVHWQQTSTILEKTAVYCKILGENKVYLFLTQKSSVYCEHIDKEIEQILCAKIDALIFITKHASKSGRPSFCVHTQGNWDRADLGGNQKEVATCPVALKHTLFRALERENNLDGFEVVNECTHHGPSIETPSMFIEIGSTTAEWARLDAGTVLAKAVERGLTYYNGESNPQQIPVIFGFGGTHTCSNFARLVSTDKIFLSHVCPEYALDSITDIVIKQAILKSTLKPQCVVDWKGMNATQRQKIVAMLQAIHADCKTLAQLKKECDSQIIAQHL